MDKIMHIVEYSRRGPLWKLVDGLTAFPNHFLLETKEQYIDLAQYSPNTFFIFHTTGKDFPMISSLGNFLSQRKKCAVFIHTLPDYIIQKGYPKFMGYISKIQKQYGCKVIVPSNMACEMFKTYDIFCKVVNLGIPSIKELKRNSDLEKYFGKIVTVSTKDTDEYKYAKGVDRFYEVVKRCGLESESIVLGNNGGIVGNIMNIRFPHDDFLSVLANAKAYVQLSRSESYNISVIEAKQLHVPVIVSDVAGHKDSVKDSWCRVKSINEATEKLHAILNQYSTILRHVNYNYAMSIVDENIFAFRRRIESAIGELE